MPLLEGFVLYGRMERDMTTLEEKYEKLSEECSHHIIRDGWGECGFLGHYECSLEICPKIREEMNDLEDWERVLGRKFTCEDCSNKYEIGCWYPYCPLCPQFKLSSKTKAEIKLKDREIEETKIDTHPKYELGSLVKNFGNEWIFTNIKFSFDLTNFLPMSLIKLEIIL